jgi:uncharacterized membrane-anchored protein
MEFWNKVAKITLLFWIMKIICTTLGETLGDFFSMSLLGGYFKMPMDSAYLITLAAMLVLFLVVLGVQLSLKKFIPSCYWLVIIATTTLGTEISDFMDRTLHFGYAIGSLVLVVCLLITLLLWYKRYHSLSVYPIFEKPKEIFYWVAILFSNSLGTAFGDFLSDNLGLSYLQGALITASIIVVVILLHYFAKKINAVLLFWLAFVFTRPFGATFGDFLTKPIASGGLNLSRLYASLTCLALIAILIFMTQKTQKSENNQKINSND